MLGIARRRYLMLFPILEPSNLPVMVTHSLMKHQLLENIAKQINKKCPTLIPSHNVCKKSVILSCIIKHAYAKSIIKTCYNWTKTY